MALFTLLPHCLSLSDSTKETGIQTLIGWFWGTLAHHLFGLPAFRIKLSSLPQQLAHLRLVGLPCGVQSELGLSNSIIPTFSNCVAGRGDPFQGPRVGFCLTLGNELSEETHVLTKQKTLLGRGAWA